MGGPHRREERASARLRVRDRARKRGEGVGAGRGVGHATGARAAGALPLAVQSADIVRRGKAKDNQTNAKDKARPPSIDPCRRVAWSTTCQVGAGAGGHSVADGSAPQRHTATSAPERPHSKRKSHQHSVEYPRCHNLQHRGQGRVRWGEPRGGAAWRTRRRQTALQASAPSACAVAPPLKAKEPPALR